MTRIEVRWPDWTRDPLIGGEGSSPSGPPIVVEDRFDVPPPPPHVLDRGLLLRPRAFGGSLAGFLKLARSLVLASRDMPGRRSLREIAPDDARIEVERAKRLMSQRPHGSRLRQPAFLDCSGGYLVVGLPSGVEPWGSSAAASVWSESGELAAPIPLRSIDFDLRDRQGARIEDPVVDSPILRNCAQGWIGLLHDWDPGDRLLAVEVSPRPTGFMSAMAMSIGGLGIGRIVVGRALASACPEGARTFASGWSYGNRTKDLTSGRRGVGGPAEPDPSLVHIPDPDLFAACAARTWTPSLADAAWLASRPERHFLD